jgi:hypothetical protein
MQIVANQMRDLLVQPIVSGAKLVRVLEDLDSVRSDQRAWTRTAGRPIADQRPLWGCGDSLPIGTPVTTLDSVDNLHRFEVPNGVIEPGDLPKRHGSGD